MAEIASSSTPVSSLLEQQPPQRRAGEEEYSRASKGKRPRERPVEPSSGPLADPEDEDDELAQGLDEDGTGGSWMNECLQRVLIDYRRRTRERLLKRGLLSRSRRLELERELERAEHRPSSQVQLQQQLLQHGRVEFDERI
jgi:hypothetical protein